MLQVWLKNNMNSILFLSYYKNVIYHFTVKAEAVFTCIKRRPGSTVPPNYRNTVWVPPVDALLDLTNNWAPLPEQAIWVRLG